MTAYQNALSDLCGLNRSDCAKKANMSKGQWSDLLNGKIPNPRLWTCVRVAETLNVSLDALVTTNPKERSNAIIACVKNSKPEGR